MGSTGVETKKEFIKEKYLERKHIGLFERDLIKKKIGIWFNLCNQKIVQLCMGSTSKEKRRWVKV